MSTYIFFFSYIIFAIIYPSAGRPSGFRDGCTDPNTGKVHPEKSILWRDYSDLSSQDCVCKRYMGRGDYSDARFYWSCPELNRPAGRPALIPSIGNGCTDPNTGKIHPEKSILWRDYTDLSSEDCICKRYVTGSGGQRVARFYWSCPELNHPTPRPTKRQGCFVGDARKMFPVGAFTFRKEGLLYKCVCERDRGKFIYECPESEPVTTPHPTKSCLVRSINRRFPKGPFSFEEKGMRHTCVCKISDQGNIGYECTEKKRIARKRQVGAQGTTCYVEKANRRFPEGQFMYERNGYKFDCYCSMLDNGQMTHECSQKELVGGTGLSDVLEQSTVRQGCRVEDVKMTFPVGPFTFKDEGILYSCVCEEDKGNWRYECPESKPVEAPSEGKSCLVKSVNRRFPKGPFTYIENNVKHVCVCKIPETGQAGYECTEKEPVNPGVTNSPVVPKGQGCFVEDSQQTYPAGQFSFKDEGVLYKCECEFEDNKWHYECPESSPVEAPNPGKSCLVKSVSLRFPKGPFTYIDGNIKHTCVCKISKTGQAGYDCSEKEKIDPQDPKAAATAVAPIATQIPVATAVPPVPPANGGCFVEDVKKLFPKGPFTYVDEGKFFTCTCDYEAEGWSYECPSSRLVGTPPPGKECNVKKINKKFPKGPFTYIADGLKHICVCKIPENGQAGYECSGTEPAPSPTPPTQPTPKPKGCFVKATGLVYPEGPFDVDQGAWILKCLCRREKNEMEVIKYMWSCDDADPDDE